MAAFHHARARHGTVGCGREVIHAAVRATVGEATDTASGATDGKVQPICDD
jgi:hypothetical protein